MSGEVFVDTNVAVYALDLAEPEKQQRASAGMEHLWATRRGRVSFQVLQELYVTLTEKLDPGLERAAAREAVRALAAWRPLSLDQRVLEGAFAVQDRHRLSWWDALIVAAAEVAGCRYLLTEDLQHGAALGGVTVVSPFRTAPDELERAR